MLLKLHCKIQGLHYCEILKFVSNDSRVMSVTSAGSTEDRLTRWSDLDLTLGPSYEIEMICLNVDCDSHLKLSLKNRFRKFVDFFLRFASVF